MAFQYLQRRGTEPESNRSRAMRGLLGRSHLLARRHGSRKRLSLPHLWFLRKTNRCFPIFFVLAIHLLKVLLRMCADLHNRACPNHGSYCFPLLAMELQPVEEYLMLPIRPSTHLLLTRPLLGDGRRRRRNNLVHRGSSSFQRRISQSGSSRYAHHRWRETKATSSRT